MIEYFQNISRQSFRKCSRFGLTSIWSEFCFVIPCQISCTSSPVHVVRHCIINSHTCHVTLYRLPLDIHALSLSRVNRNWSDTVKESVIWCGEEKLAGRLGVALVTESNSFHVCMNFFVKLRERKRITQYDSQAEFDNFLQCSVTWCIAVHVSWSAFLTLHKLPIIFLTCPCSSSLID